MKRRIAYKIFIRPFKLAYRFIFRPKTRGVKCVIAFNNQILLIKNSYGYSSWTFPGGGVKKGEVIEEAIKREVKEEVGIRLNSVEHIGKFHTNISFKEDTVFCFASQVDSDFFEIDNIEIAEAKWFPVSEMPPLPPNATKVFNLYKKHYNKRKKSK